MRGRQLLVALNLGWALGLAAPTTHAAETAAQAVTALHHGQARFHLLQNQPFSALTGLMAAQHSARLSADEDSELLRGQLLLSYGLQREAAQVFTTLAENAAAPAVRAQARFYLAQGQHQRGAEAEAEAALARIEGPLPAALAEARDLLRAQLLMARGQYADAADVLGAMPAARAGPVARFNLGVALLKSGDRVLGTTQLDRLGQARADSEEQRSVRDRANLALGVAALKQQRADDARRLLERVRLSGVDANKALLGFGWAAIAQGQPALALVPWHELASRDASDPAVLEARLAIPYAHAALGAEGTALELYKQALVAYGAEARRLEASLAVSRSGRLIDELLERYPDHETQAPVAAPGTRGAKPDPLPAAHLAQLLAEPAFQAAFEQVRDLHGLENKLRQWRQRLAHWRDETGPRPTTLSGPSSGPSAERLQALSRRLDALLPRVAALKSEQQMAAARIATASLVRQQERLQAYAAQAQFEIAQLIDRDATEQQHERTTR